MVKIDLNQHNLFRISVALGNKMMECHEEQVSYKRQGYHGIAAGAFADLMAYAEAKKKIDVGLKAAIKKAGENR